MKHLFKSAVLTFVIILILLASSTTAQEWSEEQRKVWSNVETYWDLAIQKDYEGFMGYVHSDYMGWANSDALPQNKASFEKWTKYGLANYTWEIYDLKLAALAIFDDVAIVHYVYTGVYVDAKGEKTEASGRWTDILKEQGDKWVIIGDHGGSTVDD